MSLVQDLGLNEVIEPTPIAQWPIAVGWWLLLALALVALFFLLRWAGKAYHRKKIQRMACRTLNSKWLQHKETARFAEFRPAANLVLKQYCLQRGQSQIAAMTVSHWQQFLTEKLPAKYHKDIQLFCEQLYCVGDNDPQTAETVYQQVQQWIRRLQC